MKYTGERIIPPHDGKPGQGSLDVHELMYKEFLPAVQDKTIIDIACGCGMGTKILSTKAENVFAYDINQEAIEFAKQYESADNIKYSVADIRKIPHDNSSVDVIISIETFEHVNEINEIISEVHRVLKSNGLWCFTTPNGERYPDHRVVQFHVRHYSRTDIHNFLDNLFTIHIRETGYEHDSSEHFRRPTFGNYSVFAIKK